MPRFNDQFAAGRAATYVVSASNSRNRHLADFVCDGVADQVEINTAITNIGSSGLDGGSILLLAGTYNTTASIDLVDIRRVDLIGQGSPRIAHTGTDEIINLDGTTGARDAQNHIRNLFLRTGSTTTEAIRLRSGCDYNFFESITIDSENSVFAINPTAAFQDDGGVFTSYTAAALNDTQNDVNLLPAVPVVNDAFYIGYSTSTFRHTSIWINTAGVGTWTIVWEYWNGTAWTALSGVVDETAPWNTTTGVRTGTGFTVAGMNSVSWTVPANWTQAVVNGTTAFWVRARVSAFTGVTTQPLAGRIVLSTYVNTIGIHVHSHDIAAAPDRGNFNNIFKNINITRLGTGIFIETSGDPSRLNNNLNIFEQCNVSNSQIGVKINGGEANTFSDCDIEGNVVGPDFNYFIDTTVNGGWWADANIGALTNAGTRWWNYGGLSIPLSATDVAAYQIGGRNNVTIPRLNVSGFTGGGAGDIGLTASNNTGLAFTPRAGYPVMPATTHMIGRTFHLGTNGWTEAVIGAGATTTILPHAIRINSASADNSGRILTSLAYLLGGRTNNLGDMSRIDWSVPIFISFTCTKLGDSGVAGGQARIQIKNANTEGILAGRGFGIEISDAGAGLVLTGETFSAARSTVALVPDIQINYGRAIDIAMMHIPSIPQVDFWVNGNFTGSITTAANIPTILDTASCYFAISNRTGAGVATTSDFYISDLKIWYRGS